MREERGTGVVDSVMLPMEMISVEMVPSVSTSTVNPSPVGSHLGNDLSRTSSLATDLLNDLKWRFEDPQHTAAMGTFFLRVIAASCGTGALSILARFVWFSLYTTLSVVWAQFLRENMLRCPSNNCKIAGDVCLIFGAGVHWVSVIWSQRLISLKGVRVAPVVCFVGLGMCLRVASMLVVFITLSLPWSFMPVPSAIELFAGSSAAAAAVIFQGECYALCSALSHHCGASLNPADHNVLIEAVRAARLRWTMFLVLILVLDIAALCLYTVSALLDTRTHYWLGLEEHVTLVISIVSFMLGYAIPIVTYNEKVSKTKLALEEFSSFQRLSRHPLEFTVCGVVINGQTLKLFLLAGATSAMTGVIKYCVCLLLGVEL